MKIFKNKRKMDERELMEEYKIEHWMFWFLYFGLAASVLIQILFMGAPLSQAAGESTLLFVTAIVTVFLQVRKGQYDGGTSEPGWRSYLMYALIFSIGFTALILINGMAKGWYRGWKDVLLVAAFCEIPMFLFLYAVVAAIGTLTKKRRKNLEKAYDEEI